MRETAKFEKTLWVLDPDPSTRTLTKKLFGKNFELHYFSTFKGLFEALKARALKASAGEVQSSPLIHSSLLITETVFPEGFNPQLAGFPPFVVISASSSVSVIQHYLELGALDYFIKPLNKNLLSAKITHLIKTAANKNHLGLVFDPFQLKVTNQQGETCELTRKEYQMITIFARRTPKGLDRASIIQEIWQQQKVTSKTFDVHLFKLRQKIIILGLQIILDATKDYTLTAAHK